MKCSSSLLLGAVLSKTGWIPCYKRADNNGNSRGNASKREEHHKRVSRNYGIGNLLKSDRKGCMC
jgi:hypothetical protein